MKFRSLQAKNVWCGAIAIEGDRIAIGALVLKEPMGLVTLKDRESQESVAIDFSGLNSGTYYSLILEKYAAL